MRTKQTLFCFALITAIQFEELDNGNEASLDEKPNNGVEVTPGGPFLMRILHQKYVRIFSFIMPDRLWRFHMELVKNNQKKLAQKSFKSNSELRQVSILR